MPSDLLVESAPSCARTTLENPRAPRLSVRAPFDAAACACVFAWLLARAAIQSITIDEADSYLAFVGRSYPSHWEAAANNHVLNSLLMRLSTALFGVSQFTVRLPALLGAAVYIVSALHLVRRLAPHRLLRAAILACLLLNPFVMDHLVAARGYSLALAFLLACLAIAAWQPPGETGAALLRRAAACSAAAALSFCANFSFALVDTALLLLVALWLARPSRARVRVLAAATLPGAALAVLISGSVLLQWTKGGDLVWGASTLEETLRSVVQASLFQPNPYLLNPILLKLARRAEALFFPALGTACVLRLACLALDRHSLRDPRARFALGLAAVSGGAAVLALAAHYLLSRALHVLLPLDRTAVYVALLAFLFAGALAAVPLSGRAGRLSCRLAAAALTAFAAYFLCCLRLTYFRTWQFDADSRNVYAVLASCNRRAGVTQVSANWRYVAVLNFYREAYGADAFPEIPSGPSTVADYPPGRQLYVLYQPSDQPFIDREHLTVIYSEPVTGVAIGAPWTAGP